MFLHTNFVPKMNLQLPFSIEAYTRHVMAAADACLQMEIDMPLTSIQCKSVCQSGEINYRGALT